jgi:sortase A
VPESLERRTFLVRAALVVGLGIAGAENVVSPGARATASTLEGGHKLGKIGSLYVPRLRAQVWNMPVFDGAEDRHLNRGVGRIAGSVGPGEWGNFAIAGHRTTAVRPFYFIERLRRNDAVIVRTSTAWFTYRLIAQQIVTPRDSWVLDPAPLPARSTTPGGASRLLTIVTCTPRGTTQKRWIWWGRLSAVHPADAPPAAIN